MAIPDPEVIGEALDKLFTLQGKRILPKEERKIFIDEIEKARLPLSAVVAGINSLVAEEMKALNIAVIMRAVRSKVEPDEVVRSHCRYCQSVGGVSLRDEEKYSLLFACPYCEAGARLKRVHGMVSWNGEETQMLNGKFYTLCLALKFIETTRSS